MTLDRPGRLPNSKNRNSGILYFGYIIPIAPILATQIFSSWQSDALKNVSHYLTHNEEMKRLRTFLDTVSTNEESLFHDKEEIDDDDEYNSNHDSSTHSDTHIEVDIDSSNENDFYVGRDKITTWKKEKFRTNVRVSAKNIKMKHPGNTAISRDVSTPLESSDEMVKDLVNCTNIYIASISDRF
ncbi:hypothetical protein AVEN_117225-1 [Araneus ventricosus]|uniref:PiggyBac transposable element-derived protein domain-containing protein n=1 Tax=Araneus ventricosus TaxID=182803 RepID=A0A4Y2B061_ARAVE|nr:hypothetical protein AVEN_117225-1 [Araneus ventricosus]